MSKDKTTTGKDKREDILLKLKHGAQARSRADSAGAPGRLNWGELGLLAEGLAFASRPLKRGTWDVTERYDLGPRGAWILNLISNGLVHPTDLSTVLAVGRSLITAELLRLTEAGLIVARPGQQDRRRSELALTAAGEAACLQIRNAISMIIHANLRNYSEDDIRQFTQMLRAVRGDEDTGAEEA